MSCGASVTELVLLTNDGGDDEDVDAFVFALVGATYGHSDTDVCVASDYSEVQKQVNAWTRSVQPMGHLAFLVDVSVPGSR